MNHQQMTNLIKNFPGGAHQCAADPNLSLLFTSDGFLSMLGYKRAELSTLFDNQFINIVYPGDRAELLSGIHQQMALGFEFELEYRVLRKNGEPLWVLDKGRLINDGCGQPYYYCLLIDITNRQRQQEELRLSLERHQVIMDQATDIIFEWDIRKDTLNFSANFYKKFGYTAIDKHISLELPTSHNIHPEDLPAFMNIMSGISSGLAYCETEFRIKDIRQDYIWCRIRATAQFDKDSRPIKAIGVILDIHAEKLQKQFLIEQAQRDALTGLYNKTAVQSLVEQQLERNGAFGFQALMILDIDHFKSVNDIYGHLCGDAVLTDVAAKLKSGIGANDLAGRIGGDEFLVYFSDIHSAPSALQKTSQLQASIRNIIPCPDTAPITCSIGLVLFPAGTCSYYELFKCADRALYQQKNKGRGGVTLFDLNSDHIQNAMD